MATLHSAARQLALAFLSGDWTQAGIAHRVRSTLPRRGRWKSVDVLVADVLREFGPQPPFPSQHRLAQAIKRHPAFRRYIGFDRDGRVRQLDLSHLPKPAMAPAAVIANKWRLPAIVTPDELADWLGLSASELDWFADCRGSISRKRIEALRHYRYRWISKRLGGRRLLEMPKPRLKAIQQKVLQDILQPMVPHDAAHAFRRGRSIVTFAGPHVAKQIVLRIDLRHFFPTVRSSRIFSLFHTIGYPEAVARQLTGLCTNSAPAEIMRERKHNRSGAADAQFQQLYSLPHLPQGAPTSPALANLAAWGLDCRLAGLAKSVSADYTRYADDLVFSGGQELQDCLPRFRALLLSIIIDEGFAIHNRKTRVMHASTCQQVAGIVVNEHTNLSRSEFDRLKALLFNCARHGPRSQLNHWSETTTVQNADQTANIDMEHFRSHLLGKLGFVRMVNPAKAKRLQCLFDEIDWQA